jgi:hypothetical protein
MCFRRLLSYIALSAALGAIGARALAQQPDGAPHAVLSELAERFAGTVLACPQRLWPTPWQDVRIVFVLRGNRTGVQLTRSPGGPWTPSPVSLERDEFRLLAHARNPYVILRSTVPPTVVVFLTDTGTRSRYRAVELAAHEAFHVVGQRRFAKVGRMDRGLEVPSNPEYSYARVMLLQRLQQSYSKLAPLGRPAFWYRQTIDDQLGTRTAAARVLDRIEGSAQFVGILAVALYLVGCDATDREFRRLVYRSFDQRWEATRYANLSPDTPAYVTGLIAGLLLDATGNATWKRQVEDGASPAEILLGSQAPEQDDGDPKLRESIRESLARQDELYLPRVKQFIERVAAGDDYIVAMGWRRLLGSFNPSKDLISFSEGKDSRYFVLGVRGRFAYEGERAHVELRGQDVLEDRATPCGPGPRWIFPVPRAAVARDQQGLSVLADAVSIRGAANARARWLCLD